MFKFHESMFKKIFSNTFSQIFSKAATGIIAIFLISLLTNYLSVEMYGLYTKVYNYTGIFVFLADLGLYAISIREITNNREDSSKIVGNVMTLRLILGIFILILSTGIAFFLPGYNSSLALWSIMIASLFTIFQLLNSSILSLMQAYMKIEFSAVSAIVGKLINLGGVAIVAYLLFPGNFFEANGFYWPFIAIMIVGVISVIVNTLLNYFYAGKIVPIGFHFDWEYIKYLFKISLPYGVALFLSVVYFKIDVMILSLIEGSPKGDLSVALYSLPMKIVEVIMVIGGFYMTSILPSLTTNFREKLYPELKKLISLSFRVLFGFAYLVFIGGIVFRDYIIRIIANENYIDSGTMYNSSDAFLVVFGVILFYFISLVFIYTLVAAEKQSRLLKINIVITLFNIIGNFILIPKYSFMGAGFTTLLSQILLCFMGYYYTNKLVKIRLPWFFIIRVILAGTLIGLIGYYLITNFSQGLYFDFVVYGGLVGLLFCGYYFLEYYFTKNKISN